MASHEKFKANESLRNAILSSRPGAPQHIDAFGPDGVWIKPMMADDRDVFDSYFMEGKGQGNHYRGLRAWVCLSSMCDEAGNLLFTPADAEALGQTDAQELDKVYEAARKLSNLLNGDDAEDDAEKNLEAVQDGDSS